MPRLRRCWPGARTSVREMDARLAETLRDIELFAGFDDESLAALAETVEPVDVQGGDVLMRQGGSADCAYVVRAGRLRVTVARDDNPAHPIGEIGRGEVVGEMALLTNEPRSATVTAIRDSQLLRLPGDALATLFAHPEALRTVTSQLVRRLRRTMQAGRPTSLVATVAVVPLSAGEAVEEATLAIVEELAARTAGLASVGEADAPADEDGAVTRWASDLEQQHPLVVYLADDSPTDWTARCLRHADLILLVADATDRLGPRPVERLVQDRRDAVQTRTELVLVHPRYTVDPHGTAAWLHPRVVDRHHHLHHHRHPDGQGDAARVARFVLHRPVVLVLSGGGARGMAEVGAVRALHELGVPVDAVAGTSAGALVGGAVARAWSSERIEATLRAALVGSPPVDPTFPAVALATGRKVTEKLQEASGGLDLEDGWLPFFCVSTNLSRNIARVHRTGPGWKAIRASFAIPGVFPPVPDGGDVLVDGGLLDNLPVGRMRAEHEGALVIGVDVGARRDLAAGSLPESCVVSGWPLLWTMVRPGRRRNQMVNIVRVMTRLTELGSEAGDDAGDVVIRPEVQDLPVLDFDRFDTFVERGYRAALAVLEPWLVERGATPF